MGGGGGSGCKLYVNNLPWTVSWQGLKDHFRSAGNVVRADVFTGADGRSKGCGIVEFSTPEEAAHAIQTLNDTMLNDRKIFVREDRED
jgi:RNA recognition motif-containing protein